MPEQLTNWQAGPIGPGFFLLIAPLEHTIDPQPKLRSRIKKRKREDEALALLMLLNAEYHE